VTYSQRYGQINNVKIRKQCIVKGTDPKTVNKYDFTFILAIKFQRCQYNKNIRKYSIARVANLATFMNFPASAVYV
jgi:hypothetical protein